MRRAATKALPSQGYLRSRLDYDPETGVLTWKAREGKECWNVKFVGTRAGSLPKNARYRSIDIEGVTLLEHRVIWKWMTGQEPPEQVDHINLESADNRWENLREADPSTNQMNVASRAASGLKGAHWNRFRQHWQSSIKANGKSINLGRFDTAQQAHGAYVRAAAEHFGAYARAA
jgi:hypothetical protein